MVKSEKNIYYIMVYCKRKIVTYLNSKITYYIILFCRNQIMLRGALGFQKSELGTETFKFNIINFILMITVIYNTFFIKFLFLVFGDPYIFF